MFVILMHPIALFVGAVGYVFWMKDDPTSPEVKYYLRRLVTEDLPQLKLINPFELIDNFERSDWWHRYQLTRYAKSLDLESAKVRQVYIDYLKQFGCSEEKIMNRVNYVRDGPGRVDLQVIARSFLEDPEDDVFVDTVKKRCLLEFDQRGTYCTTPGWWYWEPNKQFEDKYGLHSADAH